MSRAFRCEKCGEFKEGYAMLIVSICYSPEKKSSPYHHDICYECHTDVGKFFKSKGYQDDEKF